MNKTIFFVMLLFLLVGAVSAADDTNITDNLNLEDASQDTLSVDDVSNELKETDDVELKSNETSATVTPTVTATTVTGTPGKEITLKTTVKVNGAAVQNAVVIFKFNGATHKVTTDANGVAIKKVKCPESKYVKTNIKTTSKKLTKTAIYAKDYTCTATVSGDGLDKVTKTFKIQSKKTTVKKYKIIKKTKTITLKLKKGAKVYKKKTNLFGIYYKINKKTKEVVIEAGEKYHGYVKFYVKEHFHDGYKWKWGKWIKIKKTHQYYAKFYKSLKFDKVKIKYKHITYKKI